MQTPQSPSRADIIAAKEKLAGQVNHTPILDLNLTGLARALPDGSQVTMKLELFQKSGSFKARGALLSLAGLSVEQLRGGVVAASGGNHALAVSWAAAKMGANAEIFMPKTTDPLRITGCQALGATVHLCSDIAEAFDQMQIQSAAQGLASIHPFDSPGMVLGSATLGMEIAQDMPDIDVMIVPVGGGGLIAGLATALKQAKSDCWVIGVEPFGADSLSRSFAAGKAVRLEQVNSVADSLSSPAALPYSMMIAQRVVDEMVLIDDQEMLANIRVFAKELSLLAEPACTAAFSALCGPLRDKLRGKNIGILACGSNISLSRFQQLTG